MTQQMQTCSGESGTEHSGIFFWLSAARDQDCHCLWLRIVLLKVERERVHRRRFEKFAD
jgi:hypothetical protein